MGKILICPVCKKQFEDTYNTGYALNGSLLCSEKCFAEATRKRVEDTQDVSEKTPALKEQPKETPKKQKKKKTQYKDDSDSAVVDTVKDSDEVAEPLFNDETVSEIMTDDAQPQ